MPRLRVWNYKMMIIIYSLKVNLKLLTQFCPFHLNTKTKGRKPSATQNLSKLQSNMNELQVEDRPEDIKSKQTDTSEPGASDVFRYGGSVGQK